ncbi:unnamed protein product [Effrenium voratum]|nr:unnamed protein product [Effrenium voratum]
MLTHFHSYREALQQLPKVVHAGGVAFHANPQDGFFYGRPGCPGANLKELEESKVGDLRARFLCTPNCDATVVAVQIHKESENRETFLPYRVVPIPPCNGEEQARLKIVEAGEKSLRDLRREACCTGGVVTCCCCPCNTVACCTSQEVLTEEIFFISDSKEPKEKPFRKAVARNPWRLWNWRLLGWAFLYISLQWLLPPVLGRISRLYAMGGLSQALCLVIFTLAVWAVVVSAAYACYRHSMAIKYFLAAMILTGLPFVFNIH